MILVESGSVNRQVEVSVSKLSEFGEGSIGTNSACSLPSISASYFVRIRIST